MKIIGLRMTATCARNWTKSLNRASEFSAAVTAESPTKRVLQLHEKGPENFSGKSTDRFRVSMSAMSLRLREAKIRRVER